MARLIVQHDHLRVRLRLLEQLGALRRSFSVPLEAVSEVTVLDRPLSKLESEVRLPGGLTRVVTLGSCKIRRGSGRAFVAVYRYKTAVAVRLHEGARYRMLVVSCPQAAIVAAALRANTGCA